MRRLTVMILSLFFPLAIVTLSRADDEAQGQEEALAKLEELGARITRDDGSVDRVDYMEITVESVQE